MYDTGLMYIDSERVTKVGDAKVKEKYGRKREFVKMYERNFFGIRLKGDDLLNKNKFQQLFMLLVEIRSILDIFGNYENNDKKNNVKTFHTFRVPITTDKNCVRSSERDCSNNFIPVDWSAELSFQKIKLIQKKQEYVKLSEQ